jgi:hypothetical protein
MTEFGETSLPVPAVVGVDRHRLAARPQRKDAGNTEADQVIDDTPDRGLVDAAGFGERGDHRDDDTAVRGLRLHGCGCHIALL